MFVFAPDSSIKTRCEGSREESSSSHCSRCSLTSSRSCSLAWSVFFIPITQPIHSPLDGHNGSIHSTQHFELFERCIWMLLKELIETFQTLRIEKSLTMSTGSGGELTAFVKTGQPPLKGSNIHIIRMSDLCLSPSTLLIRINRPPTNTFSCYAHGTKHSKMFTAFQSLNALDWQRYLPVLKNLRKMKTCRSMKFRILRNARRVGCSRG